MKENRARKPFHSAREYAEIEDRTHDEQRQKGGPARELRAVAQQKLCLHLTPVWEGDSNPDTTLRVKKGQPAAKRRISEGNSTVSQTALRSSWPSRLVSNWHNRRPPSLRSG